MQAAIYTRYGAPTNVHVVDVPIPEPAPDEVRIRVQAAGANMADLHLMKGIGRLAGNGLLRPKRNIIGFDVAGEVDAVGTNVSRFAPGDRVMGDLSGGKGGSFAQYVCAPESALSLVPNGVGMADAAALPLSGITAWQALHWRGKVEAGQQVLIHGASGGVGTYAVQLARQLGAEVTAVCSTHKQAQALALGAHHVVDYTQTDITREARQFDLTLAINGNHSPHAYCRILKPAGRCVVVGGTWKQIMQGMLLGRWYSRGQRMVGGFQAKSDAQQLTLLAELLANRKLKSHIDKRFPLSQAREALCYLNEGHAHGKVVIEPLDG